MPGRVEGKVAFITGVARGQGRSHAIRLAEEGADIIGVDICAQVDSVPYPMSTPDDLAQTVETVEAIGRRIIAHEADVRDYDALNAALDDSVGELGRLDIVSANAGIASFAPAEELTDRAWQDVIATNLTGVWHTAKAAIPHLVKGGRGGSIVITGSVAALMPRKNIVHYVAAKHGCVGITKALALELAPHMIRVNSLHPTQVDTPMVHNEAMERLFRPDLDYLPPEEFERMSQEKNALPIPWTDPSDMSNTLLFLASDEARYITGVVLPVDAGAALV